MSPPPGDVPRTPDRRSSSSALFNTFKSLTSGRLKSQTPPASLSSATGTPVRTPSLGPVLRTDSVSSAPTSVGAAGTSTTSAQYNGSMGARAPLGGPPELEELVAQLHVAQPFPERAVAVHQICKILDEYPVSNVLGLWAAASDLLLQEQAPETAEAGYALLKSCVALTNLTAVERNVFFSAACLRQNDSSFDLRLDVVSTLTHGGRDVEACESFIAPFILTSLETCFKASRDAVKEARKAQVRKGTDQPIKESANMDHLFRYIIDVCKFNSKLFSDDDLELLLKKAMSICQETTQRNDIEGAIRLFDTIITYVHFPTSSLKPCLEVLCAIHRQLEDLQEQTWNTLGNMFKSHVGQAAVSSLLHTLLDGPNRRSRQYSVYRGAIQVLQLLLLEDGRNGLPKVPISLLFPALKASIKEEHKTQESFVINLIAAMLAEERLRDLLLNEDDWSDLIDIVLTCAGRDDDREAALATAAAPETLSSEKASSAAGAGSATAGNADTAASVTSATGEPESDTLSNGDASSSITAHPAPPRKRSEDTVSAILVGLDALSADLEFVQRASIMELFSRLPNRLSDSSAENLINFHIDERSLHPSNADWLETCRSLVFGILKDTSRPQSLRIHCINTLRETYNTVETICTNDSVLQLAALLLNNIESEEDIAVLKELVDFAVQVADQATDSRFPDTVKILQRRLDWSKACSSSSPEPSPAPWTSAAFQSRPVDQRDQHLGSPCNVIASAFVRLFTRSVVKSARKTRTLYEILRHIAGSDAYDSDARLTTLKLLFRLRAESSHALVVSPSSEGESIAAVLCRTEETARPADKADEVPSSDGLQTEEHNSWRNHRKPSGSSPHSSLNRYTGRHTPASGRVSKPVPPLWMYPGPRGLPEEPSLQSSRVVFSHIDASEYPLSEDVLDMEITLWLELIISLLQKETDWEIYSYVVVHLGSQLSNQALVRSCVPQLKMLRNVLCEQIRGSTFREPPSHTLLKKADVAICFFHILTMIISYRDYFEKSEEDELVKAFLHGIGQWNRTSKWCIHALTVCCQEIPLSVGKSLDNIIQKMSQIITQPLTAVHILEFLTSLARMPELYKNFREDDFKLVFGVSFNYLRHVRDQRERATAATSAHRSLRQSGLSRDVTSSLDQASEKKGKSAEDDINTYVYALAYHVINFWFMGLKMEERPKHIPWITKNLQYTDANGRLVMEEQGHVIVDMMNMVAYSDRDDTTRDADFAQPGDGEVWKKTWIVGHSLMTIETAARTGVSMVTTRRPCGTKFFVLRPVLMPPPRHQVPLTVGLASEAFYSSSYVGILPEDIFQMFYAPLSLHDPPIALPDDQAMQRSIATFDRNATVDGLKVGVIYIGEGQMGQANERQILANDIGSAAYTSFLTDLGTLVRLKGATFNTGGLDRNDDMDGEFTYCWRDRCMELVFHITTMMPTASDPDLSYANKKRHIGNDYVNIIWNDSGIPYDFDTFPSQFNYVAIVISPESRASFIDRRLDVDPDGKGRYYKVQVISKPGFPDISPAVEPKVLAGKHVAAYCRLLAINASVFSRVWSSQDGQETLSSWRNRLREIKRLRERYGANDLSAHISPFSTSNQHMIPLPPPRDGGSGFQRSSVATFISEDTNRSSLASGSNDAGY